MPNFYDDSDIRSSSQGGAQRKARKINPVYCEYEYPDAVEGNELCANRAIRHTTPPRCQEHGGVHAADGRKRTEGGYVKVNERMAKVISGDIPLSDLDTEELIRGQLRSESGRFGRNTAIVPRAMFAKMTEELFKRANDEMKSNLVVAVEALTGIITSPTSDPKDVIKASQWMIERVMGKTPEELIVKQDKPWQEVLTTISVDGAEDYEQFVKDGNESTDPRF